MSSAPYSVRTVILSIERRVLRAGGQQTALANARAAVQEGRERAALRAEAQESLTRLRAETQESLTKLRAEAHESLTKMSVRGS